MTSDEPLANRGELRLSTDALMEKKKLSTAEILAQARAQKAKAAAEAGQSAAPSEPVAPAPAAETPAAAAASAESAPAGDAPASDVPAAPATPKSTKDILAAARAQKASGAAGGSTPAAPAAAASKAPAAGGAPKSTKDILAAARAQKAGGAPAAGATAVAEAAPAGAAKAPAKAPRPATAGAAPSVQEMLKAVREGQAAPAAPIAKAPITPKIPTRPAGKPKPEAAPRRNFLVSLITAPFALAWMLMTATSLIAVLGAARFMFPNILVEPPSKFKVGPPGDYPGGTVSNKWKDQFAIWIVHAEYQGRNLIYALSTVCTHLGCTPNWLEGEQKFKCPCHGSGFYITGINFEGPAPRPLERYAVTLAPDGMLEIDKSTKFQQEMGQWDDPKSFVEVS